MQRVVRGHTPRRPGIGTSDEPTRKEGDYMRERSRDCSRRSEDRSEGDVWGQATAPPDAIVVLSESWESCGHVPSL